MDVFVDILFHAFLH